MSDCNDATRGALARAQRRYGVWAEGADTRAEKISGYPLHHYELELMTEFL